MSQIPSSSILIGLLLATGALPARSAEGPKISTGVTRSHTIFLAEIQSAQPGEGCAAVARGSICRSKVRVRVARILKDGYGQNLAPCEFDAEIQQENWSISPPTAWTARPVRAGLSYLVFSDSKSPLVSQFESPFGVSLITDKDDAVADVDLVVRSQLLSLGEQISVVAEALTGPGKPRSEYLADYAAALLRAGNEADTASLAQTIENTPDLALSDLARGGFLFALWSQATSSDPCPNNLLHVFVTLTARYLLADRGPQDVLDHIRRGILNNFAPWILSKQRPRQVFQTALTPALRQQFRKRTLELAAELRFPAAHQERLRRLLDGVDAQ